SPIEFIHFLHFRHYIKKTNYDKKNSKHNANYNSNKIRFQRITFHVLLRIRTIDFPYMNEEFDVYEYNQNYTYNYYKREIKFNHIRRGLKTHQPIQKHDNTDYKAAYNRRFSLFFPFDSHFFFFIRSNLFKYRNN